MRVNERKWKRIALLLLMVSLLMTAAAGMLFYKSGYLDRIQVKLGIEGGGYKSSAREDYILTGWAASLDGFQADIVFMGDSITCGGDLPSFFPERSVCKLAVPGDSIQQVLYRADMVEKLAPKKIFLLVGVNNVSRGNFENTIEENYKLLLKKLTGICDKVYVQSILPVRKPSKVDNARIDRANEIISNLAQEYDCEYIDLQRAFVDEEGELREDLTKDGVHLSEKGYEVWAEQIQEFVEE